MGLCLNLCLESFSPTGNQRTKRLAKELRNFPMRRFRVRWLDTAFDGRQLDAGPAETAIDRDGRVKPRPGKNGARRLIVGLYASIAVQVPKFVRQIPRPPHSKPNNPSLHHSDPKSPLAFSQFWTILYPVQDSIESWTNPFFAAPNRA